MQVKIYPVNLVQAISKLDLLAENVPEECSKTTKALAEKILDDSQNLSPCVPVDTEALKSTGRVEQVRASGGRFGSGFAVVYGGLADNGIFVDYANQVHDDLSGRNYRRPGSGPKFVEAHYLRRTEGASQDYEETIMSLCSAVFRG